MAYNKQHFTNGQTLKAEQLNHIEQGISANAEAIQKGVVQPDFSQNDPTAPDYIKNRTHWRQRSQREIFRVDDLRELEKVHNFVVFPEFLMMKIGYKYRIEINGTFELNGETKTGVFSFEGVCESSAGYDGAVEVRFADDLALLDDMAERASRLYIMHAHSFGKTSVVITEITEIIQKLPMKYLPNGYPYTSFSPIIEQQTIEGFAIMQDPIYAVQNPFVFTPIAGEKYIVHWDGGEYSADAKEFDGAICIGNENYLYGTTGGDIPFAILYINGEGVFVATESTAASHTICIEGEVAHKLDKKYLPDVADLDAGWLAELKTALGIS